MVATLLNILIDILYLKRLYAYTNLIFAPWPPLPSPPPQLPERLAGILENLRREAAANSARNWVHGALITLLYNYIGGVIRRFALLAARLERGPIRLRPPRPRAPLPDAADEKAARKPRLPAKFGWLIELMGYQVACYGSQLRHMLTGDPEMIALMAASPQGGRILRPLCRMLGMRPAPDLPPSLFPPRAVRTSEAEPPPSSSPSPSSSSHGLTMRSRTEDPRETGAARDARLKPWQDEFHTESIDEDAPAPPGKLSTRA